MGGQPFVGMGGWMGKSGDSCEVKGQDHALAQAGCWFAAVMSCGASARPVAAGWPVMRQTGGWPG